MKDELQKIFVKELDFYKPSSELEGIGFDESYIVAAKDKYESRAFKVYNLRCEEATILKQSALSLGFDAAVNRKVLSHGVELSDSILNASLHQYRELCKKLKKQPFRLKSLALEIENSILGGLTPLKVRNRFFDWDKETYVMGILNLTPDSFSDMKECETPEAAMAKAIRLVEEGADILDIGAESTRPGHTKVTIDEEVERLLKPLKLIRQAMPDIPISIDTRNAYTAKLALDLGADIINDISAFENDKDMQKVAFEYKCPVILMHSVVPTSKNITEDVFKYFAQKIETLTNSGFSRENLIIDCGIGFNKTVSENFELIKRQKELTSLHQPILIGISRKSFISKTVRTEKKELDALTNIFTPHLIRSNTNILRVHDVKTAKKAIELSKKLY